jgi:tRNA(Ile)-lysidine synthetase-like protein
MNACSAAGVIAEASVIAVACSGGSDSAAALIETRRLAPHADVIACYVDHAVRPRASIDRDIAAVRAQATAVDARTLVAHLRWTDDRAGGSEATLRNARYRALAVMAARARASVVVTGHHAGDAAEWVLIAMLRGSGVDGVSVMTECRALADGVVIVRPLLRETKSGLADLVRRKGLPMSFDETNAHPRYARTLVREFLASWTARGGAPERTLARSARLFADDREVLDALVRDELERARSRRFSGALDARVLRAMPSAVLRRVVRMMVRDAVGHANDLSLAHCDAIVDAIRARRGGRFHAGKATVVLSAGLIRIKCGADLYGRPADDKHRHYNGAGERSSPYYGGSTVRIRAASMPASPKLTVRRSLPGDTCIPSGRKHPVSLARFLAKAGVPRDLRASVRLLCVDGRIAAAIGVRVMEPFAPTPGDETIDVTWTPRTLSGHTESSDSIIMKQLQP